MARTLRAANLAGDAERVAPARRLLAVVVLPLVAALARETGRLIGRHPADGVAHQF